MTRTRLSELDTVRAANSQLNADLHEIHREREQLRKELRDSKTMSSSFQKECESLVNDYKEAAKHIEELTAERDRFRDKADMGMRELAHRAEKIKNLESDRKTLEEQLEHMELQVYVRIYPLVLCVCVCDVLRPGV